MRWPDVYGFAPAPPRRYTSCCGFVFTVVALLSALWGLVYFSYQLAHAEYDVSVSLRDSEQNSVLSPSSTPEIPQMGLSFRLRDGSVLQQPGVVEVLFRQRYAEDGYMATGVELRDVVIPAEKCYIMDRPEHKQTTYCPKAGFSRVWTSSKGQKRKTFVPHLNSTISALPQLQGLPYGPRYAFLQATVVADLAAIQADPSLSIVDLFRGSVVFHVAQNRYELHHASVKPSLSKKTQIFSQKINLQEDTLHKRDVKLQKRKITLYSCLRYFFKTTYEDIIVDSVTQGADDMPFGPKFMEYAEEEGSLLYGSNVSKGVKSPRRVALVHINFRMADQNADIAMTPAFAFMDMIASIGGHLIFCIVVLAIPGALLNRWFFYRALKRADDDGALPAIVFTDERTIKPVYADKVLNILDSKSTARIEYMKSHIIPSVSVGSFHFQQPAKHTKSPSYTDMAPVASIFNW